MASIPCGSIPVYHTFGMFSWHGCVVDCGLYSVHVLLMNTLGDDINVTVKVTSVNILDYVSVQVWNWTHLII